MPDKRPIVVVIDDRGDLFLEYKDKPQAVSAAELPGEIKAILRDAPTSDVLLKGDARLPYGKVTNVMGLLRQAGIKKIGLITKSPEMPKR